MPNAAASAEAPMLPFENDISVSFSNIFILSHANRDTLKSVKTSEIALLQDHLFHLAWREDFLLLASEDVLP